MSSINQPVLFNRPWLSGNELNYVQQAIASGQLSGDKQFTRRCEQFLTERMDLSAEHKVLLTTSCTSALEIAALLCDIQSDDEVIMPSFTFVSTANAFVLRGAKVRFVDIRPDTLNMDEQQLLSLINDKTKAIVPVHYASVACEMQRINEIAKANDLYVIEDAAQAVDAKYHYGYCGSLSDAGAFSFHDTKNFVAGEGGALVINRPDWIERAEILREKGTNRSQFFRGQVDKYTWVDCGSSYVPSDLVAAVLMAQFEQMDEINQMRQQVSAWYLEYLQPALASGLVQAPFVPSHCSSNHHMFYLLCDNQALRDRLISQLKLRQIQATFHYVPLHSSPMAKQLGIAVEHLPVTDRISNCLIRLPMYAGLNQSQVQLVANAVNEIVLA